MSNFRNLFFCLVFGVSAMPLLFAQPVPAGLATELDATLEAMRSSMGARSLSAAMQFTDGAIWAHADGVSSLIPFENATPEHLYLIGSVTKTITSACILQLVDEGVLNLDDALHNWLDTMQYINPDITIRQLLQHTSGIYDVLNNPLHADSLEADITRIWTPEELIEYFIKPPVFAPGTSWKYSNTNYFLLGMIIKAATGNPFYTEIRNRFYAPLGLNSFAIPAFESIGSPIAHVWLDANGDNITDDIHDFYMAYMALNSTAGAAGGYFSTPTDCTKWMRTYMRGDLHSPEIMAEAKTLVNAPDSQGGKYGLGLMKNVFLGNLAYGHGGDLAYHASSWYFPEKDLSITVFTNDADHDSWDLLPVVRELLKTCEEYEPVSGTMEENKITNVSVSPNPFANELNISLHLLQDAQNISIELSNTVGIRLKEMALNYLPGGESTIKLDKLHHLPPGIYYLSILVNKVSLNSIKLIKC